MPKESRKKSSKTSAPAKPAAKARTVKKAAGGAAPVKARTKAPTKTLPPQASAPAAGGAGEGTKAPDFRLPRDGGGIASLKDYAGRQLVLFFYPRANTPGCTKEAIDFTRLAKDFAAAGTAVLGVSADSVKAQDGFRDKHQLSVPLISDEHHEMLEAYGVWAEKSLYGRKFMGIVRTTVLIGRDGRIAKVWRNVKVDGHAEAVLAAAKAL